MSEQDKPKGGIASFSIGLGKDGHGAVPVAPPPPFRVLIAGDFGLAPGRPAFNITGEDVAEILEPNRPSFSVRATNLLGSHPSELEEEISLESLKDLRPATIRSHFRFAQDLAAAGGDAAALQAHGQRYDKAVEALNAAGHGAETSQAIREIPTYDDPKPSAEDSGNGDGLDMLFSMINAPGGTKKPSDSGSLAKSAVDAFIQQTLSDVGSSPALAQPAEKDTPAGALGTAQARLFFETGKLKTVLANWQGLKLLLSEIPFDLPLELHLLQLDHDLDAGALGEVLGGYDGALQAELYDVVLFANQTGIGAAGADRLKALARDCEEADTVGLIALDPEFAGIAGEDLAAMDGAHQLLDRPGFETFHGLRESEAASHLALFWNEATLSPGEDGLPALFASGAWIALAEILTQTETETFPRLPVGVPVDFDALEVMETRSTGRAIATAARFLAGPGTAPSLAQCGINVLEGVPNRTDLLFRRGVTAKPGKEGRGSLDQALLVSRLFSLFQEALGGAVTAGQDAEEREAAVRANLESLGVSLSGQVAFDVKRMSADDQDLIGVTAVVRGGWASGQQHSFYLPASGG
ncbi:hypothetical protein [Roseibium sp. M-1]